MSESATKQLSSAAFIYFVNVVEKSGRLLKRCGWQVASIGVHSQNFELVLITSPVQYRKSALECHEILVHLYRALVPKTQTKLGGCSP